MHYCQLCTSALTMRAKSTTMSLVGERIRTLREGKGWSQGELARLANVASQTVMRIENGDTPQPTQHTVERLARALGVDYVALWGGTAPAAAPSAAPIPAGPVGLDVSLLTNVLEALETFLATHDIRPTLRKKAEIAAFLYQHFALYGAMRDDAFTNFMRLVLQQ